MSSQSSKPSLFVDSRCPFLHCFSRQTSSQKYPYRYVQIFKWQKKAQQVIWEMLCHSCWWMCQLLPQLLFREAGVLSSTSSCRGSLDFFLHEIWSGTELLLLVKMGGSSLRAAAALNWVGCSPAPWPALLTLPTSSALPLWAVREEPSGSWPGWKSMIHFPLG